MITTPFLERSDHPLAQTEEARGVGARSDRSNLRPLAQLAVQLWCRARSYRSILSLRSDRSDRGGEVKRSTQLFAIRPTPEVGSKVGSRSDHRPSGGAR
jgi:hypothetical protein